MGKTEYAFDFINLNRACPKYSFSLPKIDQIVDATTGYPRMSFLDKHLGYNQILIKKEDRNRSAFTIERGLFCYKVMPFRLKDARPHIKD